MKKLFAVLIATSVVVALSGCGKKQAPVKQAQQEPVQLTYYRLFDGEDVFTPIIAEYQKQNRNVTINYRKFTDPEQYLDLIINELAEGEGPDLFSMHNSWFVKHRKKLSPTPQNLIGVEDFQETFVKVAADDLILPDETGSNRIYGLPLYVDTLALYYNSEHFEDAVPSRGKPASTWGELQEDVFKLTKSDNSFERFERAGIALGRSDNILRAIDILYLLFIQYGVDFYDSGYTEATFASGATPPAADALAFFTGFALPSSKYYNWNAYLANDDSDEKEITTFARGKVSMIIGYSYLYEQIQDTIKDLDKKGRKTISKNVVKIAPIPQLENPETSTEKRDTFASYFAETVSRTSKHPEEAWKFLSYLVGKENLEHYHEQTKRPTSRRDMIEVQKEDAIYGVFADQIGFAESLLLANPQAYNKLFTKAIVDVLATKSPKDALKEAEANANLYIPPAGLFPITVLPEESTQ
jgi:ABC-type glycerol-3-phosphate transport system substrate-binding protein